MKRILVIDDTEELRGLIVCILSGEGYDVLEAESGEHGVRLIENEHPDLVVCDVHMPGMDGYEILGAVRNSPNSATTPFLLMTGLVSAEGFQRGLAWGEENYLVKPFSCEQLTDLVRQRLFPAQEQAIAC